MEEDTGIKSIQNLFKSKGLYQILIGNSKDAVFLTEKSQILDCNEAAVLMFGFTSKEGFKGKFPFDFSPEMQPDGTSSKERTEQLLSESKLPRNFHWKHTKSDGTLFDSMVILNSFEHENHSFLHFSITLIASDKNEFMKVSNESQIDEIKATIKYVMEKKQTDAKLKLSFSLMQATLDSTADGILVVNHSGQITSFNKKFKAIFDPSAEILESGEDAAVMESVLNKIKNPVQFVSRIQHLFKNPELESFDTIELNDGRVIERYSCVQKSDGNPIGHVLIFRDITDRKKDEQQMYLMAHTIKSINESISITDINHRILFVNPAFLKTYGYAEEELIGQNIFHCSDTK